MSIPYKHIAINTYDYHIQTHHIRNTSGISNLNIRAYDTDGATEGPAVGEYVGDVGICVGVAVGGAVGQP